MATSLPIPAWHESPEARAILAELGANPPATRTSNYAFGEFAVVYTDKLPNGYREGRPVRTLNKLYRDHGDKLVGDTGPNFVKWALWGVDQAIDAAIEAAAERRAA